MSDQDHELERRVEGLETEVQAQKQVQSWLYSQSKQNQQSIQATENAVVFWVIYFLFILGLILYLDGDGLW